MAETTLSQGDVKGKCLRVDEMKRILNELCGEIDDCAGMADLLTAYILSCLSLTGQNEIRLLSALNVLSRSLHEMTEKAARGEAS